MRLPYKCPLCGKTFRTPQGRRGHLTFKHGMGKESAYTDAIGKLISAHKEGIECVKKKRGLPRSILNEEKRKKALELADALEGDSSVEFRNSPFEGLKNGLERWKKNE